MNIMNRALVSIQSKFMLENDSIRIEDKEAKVLVWNTRMTGIAFYWTCSTSIPSLQRLSTLRFCQMVTLKPWNRAQGWSVQARICRSCETVLSRMKVMNSVTKGEGGTRTTKASFAVVEHKWMRHAFDKQLVKPAKSLKVLHLEKQQNKLLVELLYEMTWLNIITIIQDKQLCCFCEICNSRCSRMWWFTLSACAWLMCKTYSMGQK